MRWRRMVSNDLRAIHAISERLHPEHPEDEAVLADRLHLYPEGCLVLEHSGALIGYAIGHPWKSASPPPLNTMLGAIPGDATTFHIHDVALEPEGRGRGLGGAAVEQFASLARDRDLLSLSLVAVSGSRSIWERLSFVRPEAPGLSGILESYGDAVFMVRRLDGARP